MFATLLGTYPPDPDLGEAASAEAQARRTIEELDAAGLEPLTDGGARRPDPADPASVVAAWRLAAGSTSRAVKQTLTGPWTDPAADIDRLAETIGALAEAGCPMIEIAEPAAARIAAGTERDRFVDRHRSLVASVPADLHLSLAITGGDAMGLGAAALFDLPYASYAFDLIAGPDNWRLIAQAPGDRGIVCGALDPAAAAADGPEVLIWAAHYAASTGGRGLVRVGLANASDLGGLSRDRARRKVAALAEAARLAAVGPGDELAGALDPRAVDKRSAALGRYVPPRPRSR